MTLTIVLDADFRGHIETDASEHGYDPETVISQYCENFETLVRQFLARDNLELTVEVERIDAGGCTPRSRLENEDGEVGADWIHHLSERAFGAAMDAAS